MGHTYIGSEHLLLGLCREESGVAAHYLQSRGVDAEKIKMLLFVWRAWESHPLFLPPI